jgi:DNA-directed RNA polymerase subunit K/omega
MIFVKSRYTLAFIISTRAVVINMDKFNLSIHDSKTEKHDGKEKEH